MADKHRHQPQITNLNLVKMEETLGETTGVEVVFRVEYKVRLTVASVRLWRLDVGLFEADGASELEREFDSASLSVVDDWQTTYLAMRVKGYRVFGPDAAASVYIDDDTGSWSLNKTFGAIKLFIAEQSLAIAETCALTVGKIAYQTIPDALLERVIGDGWTISDYQSDKKKWWKKWRLDLDGTKEVTKSGAVKLKVPIDQLDTLRESGEIAFYDTELGWQIIKDDLNFRVFGRLVEERPASTTAWSNKV